MWSIKEVSFPACGRKFIGKEQAEKTYIRLMTDAFPENLDSLNKKDEIDDEAPRDPLDEIDDIIDGIGG